MSFLQLRRPLIVGAAGQVGSILRQTLLTGGAQEVLCSSRKPRPGWLSLDLAELRSVQQAAGLIGAVVPDAIFCCGAMTFVDGCEDDPALAQRANALGPSVLASLARLRGIPFVYFSSDYVFAGTRDHPGPYAEEAPTQPLNAYGHSKLQGERAVLRVHPEALVIRTSWVYGTDAEGKNFMSALLRQLRAGQRIRVPNDQVSTPTLNRDLAEATVRLVQAQASGLVHVTGEELLSRWELAQRIAAFFSLPGDLIEGVPTDSLGQRAPRPLHSGLRSERLAALLPGVRLRTLEEGLAVSAEEMHLLST